MDAAPRGGCSKLYTLIFPKGHNIVKNALIHQWVSLGFIEESNIFSTRQLSERYIKQLLGLSFLQLSKSPLTAGLYHEDVTLFTMHDLVHDIARLVMVDEILLDNKQDNSGGISYHYALLSNCFKPLESSTGYLAKIRALCFTNCREFRLSDGAFSSGKSLRVLDLSDCSIQKLPDYIGQLKQLRYLNAPGIQYQTILNCISKLIKLMYLSLRGSYEIVALPESNCSGIRELPESFGKLNKLVHLDFSNCSCTRSLSQCLGFLTELHQFEPI
ncbi:putative disease resistance protein RGA3 [Oryza sativa Japonica Group]|uniref:putative disease resistance protein RGA3 n=1 Tax=Oryza sativa subsp. japonica TaxID=39947 RepID=UPI00339C973B